MNSPDTIKLVQAWPMKLVLISFLVGVLAGVWLFPPAPAVNLSNMDMDEIVYNVLTQLEAEGYSIPKTKGEILDPSGFNIFHALDWSN